MNHPKLDTALHAKSEERLVTPFPALLNGRVVGDDDTTTGSVTVVAVLDRTAVISVGDEFRLVRRADLTIRVRDVTWRPVTLAEQDRKGLRWGANGKRQPAA